MTLLSCCLLMTCCVLMTCCLPIPPNLSSDFCCDSPWSAGQVLRSDLPTLVAVSPSKLRFAVTQGDSITDTKLMDAFIDGVLRAKIRTHPFQVSTRSLSLPQVMWS